VALAINSSLLVSGDVRYPFRPQGIVFHHTAGGVRGDTNSLNTCVKGRPPTREDPDGLPGPLCNYYISRSGKIWYISRGTANHAGKGNSDVITRMWSGQPHRKATLNGNIGGNSILYGIEVEYSGYPAKEAWGAQLRACAELCAYLCQQHRWPANHVVGHLEWTSRKPDPAGVNMDAFRREVSNLIAGRPISLTGLTTTVALPLTGVEATGPLLSQGYDLGINAVSPVIVYRAALQAGFSASDALTITAIAGAESRFHADAVGDKKIAGQRTADGRTWGPSYGLTQVRSIVQETGTGKARDKNRLTTVDGNLRAAYEIKNIQGFKAWSTYTTTLPATDARNYRYWLPLAVDASDGTIDNRGIGQLDHPDGQLYAPVDVSAFDPVINANYSNLVRRYNASLAKNANETDDQLVLRIFGRSIADIRARNQAVFGPR
jgi:hypothetical protein